MIRTYGAALNTDPKADAALQAYVRLFARVEHALHAAMEAQAARGERVDAAVFKSGFLKRFGITARQFNAARVALEGKRDAIKELSAAHLERRKARLKKVQGQRRRALERKPKDKAAYLARQCRLAQLHDQIESLQAQVARLKDAARSRRIALCFGSRRRFNAQHHLEDNRLEDHAAWCAHWEAARVRQFLCLGSKDETGGNQTCTATRAEDGSLTLRVRLPDALVVEGQKYLHFTGIRFDYQHADVLDALRAGRALTWRFLRMGDARWALRVSLTVERIAVPRSDVRRGCLGVDVNAGFLLVSETDRYGDHVRSRRLTTACSGLTQGQRDARRGEAVKALMQWARETGKPIVLEDLDLRGKKSGRSLETNRKVSAMAYARLSAQVHARAFDCGVTVLKVNPAYSSVQGQLKAVSLGLSVHGGAAYVLARRGHGYSERLPKASSLHRLDARGEPIQWRAPARMPAGGSDAAWREVGASISQAHAVHRRATREAKRLERAIRPAPGMPSVPW